MDGTRKYAFAAVYDENSRILILGSFPSVKSREIQFYYGNKQNRFWKTVCSFYKEEIPNSTEAKIDFLKRRKIALWDMVENCKIEGSADSSVKEEKTANLTPIFEKAKIERILLNGKLAYDLFCKSYEKISIPYILLPSTSPANPRFDLKKWEEALSL